MDQQHALRPVNLESVELVRAEVTVQEFRPEPAFEWLAQEDAADCGLASLAMIARCHGIPVTLDQLRRRLQPGVWGVNLLQLQELAAAIGLPATGIRVGPAQWAQVPLPAVVHLHEGHFVVLVRVDVTGVQVADPVTGMVTQTLASFRARCSGRALVFSPVMILREARG